MRCVSWFTFLAFFTLFLPQLLLAQNITDEQLNLVIARLAEGATQR